MKTINKMICKFCDKEKSVYRWHRDAPVCESCWDERLEITN